MSNSKVFILEDKDKNFNYIKNIVEDYYDGVEVVPSDTQRNFDIENEKKVTNDWLYIKTKIQNFHFINEDNKEIKIQNFLKDIYDFYKDSYIYIIDRHLITQRVNDDYGLMFLDFLTTEQLKRTFVVSVEETGIEDIRKKGVMYIAKHLDELSIENDFSVKKILIESINNIIDNAEK